MQDKDLQWPVNVEGLSQVTDVEALLRRVLVSYPWRYHLLGQRYGGDPCSLRSPAARTQNDFRQCSLARVGRRPVPRGGRAGPYPWH